LTMVQGMENGLVYIDAFTVQVEDKNMRICPKILTLERWEGVVS